MELKYVTFKDVEENTSVKIDDGWKLFGEPIIEFSDDPDDTLVTIHLLLQKTDERPLRAKIMD